MRFGPDMYESYVRYQGRVIRALDKMATKYDFTTIDAAKPADLIYRELQRHISSLFLPPKPPKRRSVAKKA